MPLYPFHILHGKGLGLLGVEGCGKLSSAPAPAETSPPHSRAPGGGALAAGDTLFSLLPPPLTSWNCYAFCPQFCRSAGVSGRLSIQALHT